MELPTFAGCKHWDALINGRMHLPPDAWWCMYCLDPSNNTTGWKSAESAFSHIKAAHDILAPNTHRDVISTGNLIAWVEGYFAEVEAAVEKMKLVLADPVYGPEDLVVDAGYRAPGEFGEF